MSAPFEDLIRATLSDLAEEAPTVQDQLMPAERRARNRRRTTVTLGAAGVVAAVLIGAPIAVATGGADAPRPAGPAAPPGSPAGPTAVPSPSGPPTAVPSPSGDPMNGPTASPSIRPSRPGGGPVPTPSRPGGPTAIPSPEGPGGGPGVPGPWPTPSPSPRR